MVEGVVHAGRTVRLADRSLHRSHPPRGGDLAELFAGRVGARRRAMTAGS